MMLASLTFPNKGYRLPRLKKKKSIQKWVHNPLFEIPGPDAFQNSGFLDCRKVTSILYIRCGDIDDVSKTHSLSGVNITEESLLSSRQLCKQIQVTLYFTAK